MLSPFTSPPKTSRWLIVALMLAAFAAGLFTSQVYGTRCYVIFKQAQKPPARSYDL